MANLQTISRVVNLLDESRNILYGLSVEDARAIVARGVAEDIRKIDGQFALVAK